MNGQTSIPADTGDVSVDDRAAQWLLRLQRSPDEAALAEFEVWRAADPAHDAAFAAIADVWDVFDEVAAEPELIKAREDALNRARASARSRWGAQPPVRAIGALAACLVLAVTVAVFLWPEATRDEPVEAVMAMVFETGIGETRVVTLDDNSRLSLDAMSRARVSYSTEGRLVDLESGQAFFDVAHDPGRPFEVTAGGKTIVALGTAFNVELVGDDVLVTLIEGRVAVSDAAPNGEVADTPAPEAVQELTPGQRLTAAGDGPGQVDLDSNTAATTAWRRGMLVFEDEPLGRAVERMNRYSRIPLVTGDDAAAALAVSGVFEAGDADAFVGALQSYFGVTVERLDDGSVVISSAA